VIIDGKPTRTEIPSYDMSSAREAILNCYCHRDFFRKSNIKIEFFDDRCEIISPGGFFDGLTLEDALNGLQSFRNENLVKLLYKLEYVENYASGLTRIFQNSKELDIVPEIYTSLNMFKVTLPNKNYEALYLNPEKHIEDNKVKSNGRVNSDINEEDFQLENQKDIEILEIIRDNPGIRLKEIAPKLKSKYPSINSNIIYKRIKILDSYIEFRGIPKKGG